MKNRIIFLVIFLSFVAGCTFFFFFVRMDNVLDPNSPLVIQGNQETAHFNTDASSVDSSQKVTVETVKGKYIQVNNFIKNSKTINFDGDLALTPPSDAYSIPDYDISFYKKGAVFRVSINKMPIDSIRQMAESEFLNILGIPKEDACLLNVYVGVSKDADENFAGRNIGLSFCSESVPLHGIQPVAGTPIANGGGASRSNIVTLIVGGIILLLIVGGTIIVLRLRKRNKQYGL